MSVILSTILRQQYEPKVHWSLELFLADSETASEQEEEDVSDYGDNVETNSKY